MVNSLKHWLYPQTVKTFASKYNTQIELVKFMGELRLDMGELTQSGKIIESIWGSAIRKLLPHQLQPKKILILGLGAGSAASLLSRKWKNTRITGVEIDPVVIKIGKEYFGVDKINNLTVVNRDAINYVKHLNADEHYSLVLVDCYLGYQIPSEFENIKFLKLLKSHTDHLLLNRIFWDDYQKQTITFINKLNQYFQVETCRTPSNLVLSLK